MTIADPSSQPRHGWWEHVKTKQSYSIIAFGLIEKTLEPSVIYQGANGQVWVRPCHEFFDGRFKQTAGPF